MRSNFAQWSSGRGDGTTVRSAKGVRLPLIPLSTATTTRFRCVRTDGRRLAAALSHEE